MTNQNKENETLQSKAVTSPHHLYKRVFMPEDLPQKQLPPTYAFDVAGIIVFVFA